MPQSFHIAFVLLVGLASSLYAQTDAIVNDSYDPSKVRAAIASWGREHKIVQGGRPTILIATSLHQCAGCCATAINEITRTIASDGLDANVMVVIGADTRGEGIAIRDRFVAENVSEDSKNILTSVFHASQPYPDLLIVDPLGNVVNHLRDVQHNNAISYDTYLRAGVRPMPIRGRIIGSKSVHVSEPPKKKLADAQSVALDASHNVVSFIEPNQNSIYQFDANSGKLIAELSGFDSLKFRFRDPHDDPRGWKLTDSLYSPMVALESFVRARPGNDLSLIVTLFTGYSRVDSQPGKQPYFLMRKERAVVVLNDGTVRSIRLLPSVNSEIQVGDPLLVGNGKIVSMILNEDLLTSKSVVRDSISVVDMIDQGSLSVSRILTLAAFDSAVGHLFNPRYVGAITWCGDSSIFYVSEGNQAFVKMDIRPGHSSVLPIYPAATLQQLFVARQLQDTTVMDSISVLDATADSSALYILLSDTRRIPLREQMVLQRYDLNGQFQSEERIRSREDEIVSASFAGVDDHHPVVLVKWKKLRWTIETLVP